MGCLLALKENRPAPYWDIREYFEYLDEDSCPDRPDERWESSLEKDHGRLERRWGSRPRSPKKVADTPRPGHPRRPRLRAAKKGD
jgi:hypothetical protein